MYSVDQLTCLWQVQSGQFAVRDPSVTKQKSHDTSHDNHLTGLGYRYGDLFYMGEINSNGTSIVVEERENASTMVHLYSPDGELVRSLCLKSIDGIREVHTHMISSDRNGYYVIMTQGGYALVIKGTELVLTRTINIVR